jgi:L,D-transpeptidase catalytic domain
VLYWAVRDTSMTSSPLAPPAAASRRRARTSAATRLACGLTLLGTVWLVTGPGAAAAEQLAVVGGGVQGCAPAGCQDRQVAAAVEPARLQAAGAESVRAQAAPAAAAPVPAPALGPAPALSSLSGPLPVAANSWLTLADDTPLWLDAAGTVPLGIAPAGTELRQLDPLGGARVRVEDPYTGRAVYADAAAAKTTTAPDQTPLPGRWWGKIGVNGARVRAGTSMRDAVIGDLPLGTPVVVSQWVAGEQATPDNPTWAKLADGVYVHSSVLRPVDLPTLPAPPEGIAGLTGRWLDVNLTHQVVVAYEGPDVDRPRRLGDADGHVPRAAAGAKETMSSSTLSGLGRELASYKIDNVRWTQYFSEDGKALHENYWKPRDQIGVPSSHGCVGLAAEDAKFLWDFATVGTPIIIHD